MEELQQQVQQLTNGSASGYAKCLATKGQQISDAHRELDRSRVRVNKEREAVQQELKEGRDDN